MSAHRRVLTWLVKELSAEQGARLVAELSEPYPPQDGQEDPGAVPVEEFAGIAACSAELQMMFAAVDTETDGREVLSDVV
ncbi:MAG: hypothetical protein ACK46Q_12335 [Hyphomonas sp.]